MPVVKVGDTRNFYLYQISLLQNINLIERKDIVLNAANIFGKFSRCSTHQYSNSLMK